MGRGATLASLVLVAVNFTLDREQRVTVWLLIMRSQAVTHSAFDAIADPTRRAVLDILRKGPQPAGKIALFFPISRPAVSRHLRLLRRTHLVLEQRSGRERLYALNPDPLRVVDEWLSGYRAFWSAQLAGLKAYVESNHARERQKRQKSTKKRRLS